MSKDVRLDYHGRATFARVLLNGSVERMRECSVKEGRKKNHGGPFVPAAGRIYQASRALKNGKAAKNRLTTFKGNVGGERGRERRFH